MTKSSKLIVVVGMHRSGTSAITRGLQVMGVALGDRMLPPMEGNNAKGFWEDIDLNELNILMLKAIGSDWYHLSAIDRFDIELLHKKGYFARAIELLRQKVDEFPGFGFKDPRVAKLLPFWKEVFTLCRFDVSYVIAVRHPLSVVKSLFNRDGIEAEQGYLMWLGHVISILNETKGFKRVLVDYDRLMQAPDQELMRVAKYNALEIDRSALQSYKNDFLDNGLQHTVYEPHHLFSDGSCPPLVREIYTALLDVASEKANLDDLDAQNRIARWLEEFERLKVPLQLIDKLLVQKMNILETMAEHDLRIAALNQSLAEHKDGIHLSLKSCLWHFTKRLTAIIRGLKTGGNVKSGTSE